MALFQERHIAVTKILHQRNRNVKIIKEPSRTKEFCLTAACAESPHICIHKNSRIYCTECSMSVASAAPHVFDILQSACTPDLKHVSYPVGNRFTHPAHSILLDGGVFMCTACGATAVNKLIKLHDPCFPHRYGPPNYNLRAYKAGRARAGFPLWPYKHIHE